MYLFYVMDVNVIYTNCTTTLNQKAIAFDLDETIGSFSDFYSIWARLDAPMKSQKVFNDLLDLYPEFLRVGILSILRYIKSKQDSGVCLPINIYTNNQCEDVAWIYKLVEYLEWHVVPGKEVKLFARPICAYKIKGRVVEQKRTTHEKTYGDFVRCAMLTTSHDICFIDDAFHKKMEHRRVYYIQPPPYVHTLTHKQVVDRFMSSNIYAELYPGRVKIRIPDKNNHSPVNHPIPMLILRSGIVQPVDDKEEQKITNDIMYHIREFFLITSRRKFTKKSRHNVGKYSRKQRRPK